MKHLLTSLYIAIGAATTFGAAAVAEPPTDPPSRVVHVGDLDLHSKAGAHVAAQRIQIAANAVCGSDSTLWRPDPTFVTCRNAAIDRALASLQSPMVSAELGRQTPTGMASR